MDNKLLMRLRTAEELYVIISRCTRVPFALCDPETYDDEVLLYWTEEDAQKGGKLLLEQKDPVQIAKLENRHLLQFYSSLFTMGINSLAVSRGLEEEVHIQLEELVNRPDVENLPEGKVWVENPQFHLTAIYFLQGLRKKAEQKVTEDLEDLQEEMLVNFQRGRFIVAVEPDKGMPILKQKDGPALQPLFTDAGEFQKFNRENKYRSAVIEYAKIPDMLSAEVGGVLINPGGINLPLNVARKKKDGGQ